MGSTPGLIGKCCHGKDEAKVYMDLCGIVDEWIKIYEEEGLRFPSRSPINPSLENSSSEWDFAELVRAVVDLGASFVGGCCGTSPEFIRGCGHAVRG